LSRIVGSVAGQLCHVIDESATSALAQAAQVHSDVTTLRTRGDRAIDAANVGRVNELDVQCREQQSTIVDQAERILTLENQLAATQCELEIQKKLKDAEQLKMHTLELQVQLSKLEAQTPRKEAVSGAPPPRAPETGATLGASVSDLRRALGDKGCSSTEADFRTEHFLWFRSGGMTLGVKPKGGPPGLQSLDWKTRFTQLRQLLDNLRTDWPEDYGVLPPYLEQLNRALEGRVDPEPGVVKGDAEGSSTQAAPVIPPGPPASASVASVAPVAMDVEEEKQESDKAKTLDPAKDGSDPDDLD
jgi:hypothetical protein